MYPAVDEVLKSIDLDALENGTYKSICLTVKALGSLERRSCFTAMNDLSEAVLSDPSPFTHPY